MPAARKIGFLPTGLQINKNTKEVYMYRPILKKLKLHCSNCNKEFQKYPSQVKNNKTIFCGNECLKDYRIKFTMKEEKSCKSCLKVFIVHPCVVKRGNGIFCSKGCMDFGKQINKNCLHCNKKFITYLSNIKRGGGNYCSRNCFNFKDPKKFFFENIKKNEKDCWIWQARKDKNGYGIMWVKKAIKSHRYSYELHKGKIINDLLVCHHCDNPPCVNPDHLFLGTHYDNAQDKVRKNRQYKKLSADINFAVRCHESANTPKPESTDHVISAS